MRAPYLDKINGMKKGAWSEEEDNKLRAYILRYGHWNWRLLPKFAGLARCGKSCRLRWVNYLKPGVKRGNYSKEEEDLIAKLHDELGNKWSAIAAKLPGRTDNEIKNYWHTHLKKRNESIRAALNNNSSDQTRYIGDDSDGSMKFLEKLENFQGSDIPILESSGSDMWNCCPLNWDSEDSSTASSSRSVQEVERSNNNDFLCEEVPVVAETSNSAIGFSQDVNDEIGSSSDSFESFWNEPFLVDYSYIQLADSFPGPLEEGAFFSGYLFT